MLANPLVVLAIVGVPIGFVVLLVLWKRARTLTGDHWLEQSGPRVQRHPRRPTRHNEVRGELAPRPRCDPDASPELLAVCEKALFCWDYWSSGKAGAGLDDVFKARDVPNQLRAGIAKARENR